MPARLVEFAHRDVGADVLVVTNMWPDDDWPVYGIFVKRQVDSLRERGVRCDVLYIRGYRSSLAYPLAVIRLALAGLTWRGRYKLVHVHAGETALAARFFVGPPLVVSYCGDDVLGNPDDEGVASRASACRSALIRTHAHLASATITKSREMAQRMPPAVQRKNTVIPNGVDGRLFAPVERDEARRRLGWDRDERVALFAATKPDNPRKRRVLAEEVVADVNARGLRVRLHVSGLTPPDEMPLVMSAADCLLHVSSLEGSPNVVKEALMCNLPVVATPSGDIAQLLDGVKPSHLCPPDPAVLADALQEVLSEPRRSNGRARIEHVLSAEATADRVLALYERLLEPRPTAAPVGA